MSGDCMIFPKTIEEFIDKYKFTDKKEVYTNGSELIPVFRVEQAIEHYMPKRGKWTKNRKLCIDVCSVCHGTRPAYGAHLAYCPHCGAKMK